MNEFLHFFLISVFGCMLWMGLALVYIIEWDTWRQHQVDLWIQHGVGITHKNGCLHCTHMRDALKPYEHSWSKKNDADNMDQNDNRFWFML